MAVVRCVLVNMATSVMSRTYVTSNRDCIVITPIPTVLELAYVEVLHEFCMFDIHYAQMNPKAFDGRLRFSYTNLLDVSDLVCYRMFLKNDIITCLSSHGILSLVD